MNGTISSFGTETRKYAETEKHCRSTHIPTVMGELVRLRCVKEGNKLRMKIISPGYSPEANCQFPKDIRVEGREYTVPKSDVALANTRGKFFYRVRKNNIVICPPGPAVDLSKLKIYGDENMTECNICMTDISTNPNIVFVILAPCGHYCSCAECAKQLKTCPLCRAQITQIVTKDQLQ